MDDNVDSMLAEQETKGGSGSAFTDFNQLPYFPGFEDIQPARTEAQKMGAAYCWASYMVYWHGIELAPYHAMRALFAAIDSSEPYLQAGWLMIIKALADLAREPEPGEARH